MKVRAVKLKPNGKWHRQSILNDAKTNCGFDIREGCRQAEFDRRAVVSDPDWVPPQRCRKCFCFDATDYVLDSVGSRARSVSELNWNCYRDSYIYQICSKLIDKGLIHICCISATTGANLYRVGDGDMCPERKVYHPNLMSKTRQRNLMTVYPIVNDERFWLEGTELNR
jgi:hypothetical protein